MEKEYEAKKSYVERKDAQAKESVRLLTDKEKEKMRKLIIGNEYYIQRNIYFDKQVVWTKYIYLGECGVNNCILMFKRPYRFENGEWLSYNISFVKNDYLFDAMQILTKDEYKRRKSLDIWDKIYKLINDGNGKDGHVI